MTMVPTMPMNHSQKKSLNAWVICGSRCPARNAAAANAISENIIAGVKIAAASTWVSVSMPHCPSARRRRSTITAWKGIASAAASSAPASPKRTHRFSVARKASVCSAVSVGDIGGKSLAMPEKHTL